MGHMSWDRHKCLKRGKLPCTRGCPIGKPQWTSPVMSYSIQDCFRSGVKICNAHYSLKVEVYHLMTFYLF